MCGRYTLTADISELERLEWYEELLSDHRPCYNIAPGQEAPIVGVTSEGRRVLQDLRWGLVPFWADNEKMGYRMINARAETAHETPAFRAAFERR